MSAMNEVYAEPSLTSQATGRAMFGKVLFDRLTAVLLLIPSLPVMAIVFLLVRLTSRGPAIYAQVRTGLNGRNFTLYKFRSMRVDAELGTGAVWSPGAGDPRITRLGRFLRKSHLDELPQLFNVLKGDMSLVGPRPERPEIIETLVEEIPEYPERLAVLPGVTGLAQVNLPPDTDLDSVRLKLILDREYINTFGAGLDARIILCTGLRVFGLSTQGFRKMLGVHRCPTLPTPIESTDSDVLDLDVEPREDDSRLGEPQFS